MNETDWLVDEQGVRFKLMLKDNGTFSLLTLREVNIAEATEIMHNFNAYREAITAHHVEEAAAELL